MAVFATDHPAGSSTITLDSGVGFPVTGGKILAGTFPTLEKLSYISRSGNVLTLSGRTAFAYQDATPGPADTVSLVTLSSSDFDFFSSTPFTVPRALVQIKVSNIVVVGCQVSLALPGTPPVINNFFPAVGSSIQPETIINFDIVDLDNFARIMIVAAYVSGRLDVIHDGDAFAPFYAGSTRTPISGGFTYSFIRSGGWSEDPTITPYAVDSFGTENL